MSEFAPLLGREGIEEAFRRLGDRLAKRGVVPDIYVFGGAAMALARASGRIGRRRTDPHIRHVTGAVSHSRSVAAQAPGGTGHEDSEPHDQVQDPAPLKGAAG